MKKLYSLIAVVTLAFSVNAQTNLVQNPGFESDLASWVIGSAGYTLPNISTTDFHGGAKSAWYDNPSSTTGFLQNVAINGSTVYTLSYWYKASTNRPSGTTQNNIFRLWSVMKDTAGTPVYNTGSSTDDELRSYNGYLPLASEWTQKTVVFTSHASAASIDVAFRSYGNGSSWVDDVFLVEGNLSTVDFSSQKRSLVKNTQVTDQLVFAKNAEIQIFNANGQVVKSAKVSEGTSLNVSSLAPGMYVVKGEVDGQLVNQKIIKK